MSGISAIATPATLLPEFTFCAKNICSTKVEAAEIPAKSRLLLQTVRSEILNKITRVKFLWTRNIAAKRYAAILRSVGCRNTLNVVASRSSFSGLLIISGINFLRQRIKKIVESASKKVYEAIVASTPRILRRQAKSI
jgi:hypothetical protein